MTGTDLCVNRPQSVPVIFEPRCNLGGGGWGTRWRSWLRHYATSRRVTGSIPDGVIHIILPAALWPSVESASKRKEYLDYFLGGKGGRCVGLTLPHSCADCL